MINFMIPGAAIPTPGRGQTWYMEFMCKTLKYLNVYICVSLRVYVCLKTSNFYLICIKWTVAGVSGVRRVCVQRLVVEGHVSERAHVLSLVLSMAEINVWDSLTKRWDVPNRIVQVRTVNRKRIYDNAVKFIGIFQFWIDVLLFIISFTPSEALL